MSALSYEGSENYIFISYAHKDSDAVLPILEKLVDAGYRIWYDDGIAPGSEWPENIASHLDGCAVFMAFVSNQSIDSANCRREVTFALNREKPFLGILLEPAQMSLGMEMQITAHQCILRYNYRRESDFIDKIFSCPDIACCKIPPEPTPEEMPEPIVTEETPEQPQIHREPAPKTKPKKASKPKKAPKPKKEKKPRSKKKKLVLGILGGLLALVVLRFLLFNVILPIRVIPGETVGRNETYLSLRGQMITENTVKNINKLKKLQNLAFYDCGVERGVLEKLELPMLNSFTMENTPGKSFDFLEKSPELVNLRLTNCKVTNESFDLSGAASLKYISLKDNPEFMDLSRLNVPILRELDISGTGVTDISSLAQAEYLVRLKAADTNIASIDVLADLEDLKTIDFTRCDITQITQPFLSLSMTEVYLDGNGLQDISGFCNFTVLQVASLGDNQLSDISLLEKSTATLQLVNVERNPLSHNQLQFLANCKDLTDLNINDIPMEDLELTANLTQLKTLSASRCGLTEIPDLTEHRELKKLLLDGNQLTELTGLPTQWTKKYIVLDLSGNQLTTISALPDGEYTTLCLQGNPITFDEADFAGKDCSNLYVDYDESLLNCGNFKNYGEIYVRDCPADRQLALEDVLGYRGKLVNAEQMKKALLADGREYPQ